MWTDASPTVKPGPLQPHSELGGYQRITESDPEFLVNRRGEKTVEEGGLNKKRKQEGKVLSAKGFDLDCR
jgi:hypothetical protein